MPEISVIVPVYKVEPYLCRCVDSILAQTFTDFELILVDDGSPDNCGAICDEYAAKDERIHVIHQENQGQAAARNHALDWVFINSKSEYISFVDSDDWIHSRYLELLVEGIRRYNVNICQCGYFETESSNPESSNQIIVNPYLRSNIYTTIVHLCGISCFLKHVGVIIVSQRDKYTKIWRFVIKCFLLRNRLPW